MIQYTHEQIRWAKKKIDEEERKKLDYLRFHACSNEDYPEKKRIAVYNINMSALDKFLEKYDVSRLHLLRSTNSGFIGFKYSSSLFKKKYQLLTRYALLYTTGPKSALVTIGYVSDYGFLTHAEAKDNFIYVHYDNCGKSEVIRKCATDDNAEAEYYARILNAFVDYWQVRMYGGYLDDKKYERIPEHYFDIPQQCMSASDDDDCLPMFF